MEFIEVTERNKEFRVLVPVDKIYSICDKGVTGCFIETGVDNNGDSYGFDTVETYEEIVGKLTAPLGATPSKRSILGAVEEKMKKSNLL